MIFLITADLRILAATVDDDAALDNCVVVRVLFGPRAGLARVRAREKNGGGQRRSLQKPVLPQAGRPWICGSRAWSKHVSWACPGPVSRSRLFFAQTSSVHIGLPRLRSAKQARLSSVTLGYENAITAF